MAKGLAMLTDEPEEPFASERTVRLGDFVNYRVVWAGTVSKIDKDGNITLSNLDSQIIESETTVIRSFPSLKEGDIIRDGNSSLWTAYRDPTFARGKLLFQPLNIVGNVISQPKTIDELIFPVSTLSLTPQ